MPTGYTSMIDDNPNMTTRQWFMEGLARAFGVCVTLREDSLNLTEAQILQRISKDRQGDVAWHKKELKKAKLLSEQLKTRTDAEWKTAWQTSEAEKIRQNNKSIAKAKTMKKKHTLVQKDLELIVAVANNQVTKNIATYGLGQLNMVKDECEPYINEATNFENFKAQTLKTNTRDIEYHVEEMTKAQARAKENVEAYLAMKADMDTIFSAQTKPENNTNGENRSPTEKQ